MGRMGGVKKGAFSRVFKAGKKIKKRQLFSKVVWESRVFSGHLRSPRSKKLPGCWKSRSCRAGRQALLDCLIFPHTKLF